MMTCNDPDATDFTIKCRACLDAGRVHPRLENGKPDYQNTIPCRACQTPEKIAHSLGVSSMDATFENIRPKKGMEAALSAARQIATLQTDWKMLMIYGGWGNGKTRLLEGIAIELSKKGLYVHIQTFPEFMGQLKNSFERAKDSNDPTFNAIIERVCNMPHMLMDDVGQADSYTDFSKQQLERIMLARERQNLFTVMTTNKDLSELPNMVRSRFSDKAKARLILNAAPDYRPLKGGK
jgi:DNA replication protein DnaC